MEPVTLPAAGRPAAAPVGPRPASAVALRWAVLALGASVWASATLFGLYILAFYAGALADGEMTRWNEILPGLYERGRPLATGGIGLHFAAGGVVLVLGSVQLLGAVRRRAPAAHRWIGRVYVAASLLAGVGGLAFIAVEGTVGGAVMDAGFSLYGALMILAALETVRHARAGRTERHRAWALRLYALAIGSWLYRMDYGFWLMLTGGLGHTGTFDGPFDRVMAFWFYLPNLLVVEAVLRARRTGADPALRWAATGVLGVATLFLLVGTYYFTTIYWGPAIVERLVG